MSTLTEIITVRKEAATTGSFKSAPIKQVTTKRTSWYKSEEQRTEDANELKNAINDAREARLALERTHS